MPSRARAYVGRAVTSLPSKKTRPSLGETWPVKLEAASNPMGTLVIDLNYLFKGWEDHEGHKCVRLDYFNAVTDAWSQPSRSLNGYTHLGKIGS